MHSAQYLLPIFYFHNCKFLNRALAISNMGWYNHFINNKYFSFSSSYLSFAGYRHHNMWCRYFPLTTKFLLHFVEKRGIIGKEIKLQEGGSASRFFCGGIFSFFAGCIFEKENWRKENETHLRHQRQTQIWPNAGLCFPAGFGNSGGYHCSPCNRR